MRAVNVMIGANNYGFAAIVERCVTNWATSPSWWKNYCSDDSDMTSRFTAARQTQETNNVRDALLRVRQAMTNAGYNASQYTIIAQTYWTPIPRSTGFRYAETGWTRQSIGGCGVWNRDANWAHDTVVAAMNGSVRDGAAQAVKAGASNLVVLDLQNALDGRRLCESGVGVLEEVGIANWQSPGAVDRTEWVSQIRTVTTITGPYQLQEGSHASYWGQLAMRNCLRLAYNNGYVRGGKCVRMANGLTSRGEPQMEPAAVAQAIAATASTSTRRSGRNSSATCTSELVGGRAVSTNSSRTERTVASSSVPVTKNVSFTTSPQPAPPAASARPTFSNASRVCASQPLGTSPPGVIAT